MAQSDCEAPAHAASGALSLGRTVSPWTVLAWAALLVAIVVSFRPAVPVIWGDTPSFVESALQTLEAGRPTVAGGRDPGYPTFLAVTFAFGGDFATVVRLAADFCNKINHERKSKLFDDPIGKCHQRSVS